VHHRPYLPWIWGFFDVILPKWAQMSMPGIEPLTVQSLDQIPYQVPYHRAMVTHLIFYISNLVTQFKMRAILYPLKVQL